MPNTNIKSNLLMGTTFKPVNRFYRSFKLNVSCHQSDLVAVSYNGDKIIGAGLIRCYLPTNKGINIKIRSEAQSCQSNDHPELGQFVLRSLFVDPEHRHYGIAKQILTLLCNKSDARLLLSCPNELTSLYQPFGFRVQSAPDNKTPNVLIKEHKKGLTLMCRP
ncbi:GNAT family N-acetyltransferase [Psychrosphaera algicola]|uniref:GNAT family N-acetyltransferase n=1 Tax=Psychrosphaera algicola TaxID=3023714 RepID=A0ABT5FB17_9GAMM|nr:GNAT family N-acetyltransferase [Psychrosphaera sp. G1-22]MDC2887781.1 GNAT family N-acetyltransferase [Psychrosphaera sp. G1-22]